MTNEGRGETRTPEDNAAISSLSQRGDADAPKRSEEEKPLGVVPALHPSPRGLQFQLSGLNNN